MCVKDPLGQAPCCGNVAATRALTARPSVWRGCSLRPGMVTRWRQSTPQLHGRLTVPSQFRVIMRLRRRAILSMEGGWRVKDERCGLFRQRQACGHGHCSRRLRGSGRSKWLVLLYSTKYLPAQAANGERTIQTATVGRGNLVIVASGTGR